MSPKKTILTGLVPFRKRLKPLYLAIPFKRQFFLMVKRVWIPPAGIRNYLQCRDTFKVDVEDKYFYVNQYSGIENSIFWLGLTGGWEKISMSVWIELCKQSSVILDIGANSGIYSLVAKAVNPKSRVYAFEPMKRVFAKLVANNELNDFDILCKEMAISNFDGEAIMYDAPDVGHTVGGTVNKNLYPPTISTIPTVVRARRLSTVIKEEGISKVDLIKIDVESHEPEVLEGMGEYLGLMKPTILLEVWNDGIGKRCEELLKGKDYLFLSTDEINPFKPENHIRNPNPARGYLNYLVCSQQVMQSLDLDNNG